MSPTVPSITAQHLQTQTMISWEKLLALPKSIKIVHSSLEELQAIYQMTEGLEYRLKDQIQAAGSFSRINGTYEKRSVILGQDCND